MFHTMSQEGPACRVLMKPDFKCSFYCTHFLLLILCLFNNEQHPLHICFSGKLHLLERALLANQHAGVPHPQLAQAGWLCPTCSWPGEATMPWVVALLCSFLQSLRLNSRYLVAVHMPSALPASPKQLLNRVGIFFFLWVLQLEKRGEITKLKDQIGSVAWPWALDASHRLSMPVSSSFLWALISLPPPNINT